MGDLDDDQTMTAFLLGQLEEPERSRVDARLAEDPDYFEAMAALDDDLIVRWHRGWLSPEQRGMFEREYLTNPVRKARVDADAALLDALPAMPFDSPQQRRAPDEAAAPARRWWARHVEFPRYVLAAASLALVTMTAAATFAVLGQRDLDRPGGRVIARFQLTAIGDRGPGSNRTMDRVDITPGTDDVQLIVDLDGDETGPFDVVLEGVDGEAVTLPAPPSVGRRETATEVSVTIPQLGLSSGDYILLVQRRGERNPEVVARRAFRVSRAD